MKHEDFLRKIKTLKKEFQNVNKLMIWLERTTTGEATARITVSFFSSSGDKVIAFDLTDRVTITQLFDTLRKERDVIDSQLHELRSYQDKIEGILETLE